MGTGITGQSDILGVELPPCTGRFLPVFDASETQGSSSELRLRFTVSVAESVSGAPGPAEVMESSGDERPESPRSTSVLVSPGHVEPLAGPFTFEFTVPVTASE